MFIYDSIIIVRLKTLINTIIIASTTTATNTATVVTTEVTASTKIILKLPYFLNSSMLFMK